MSRNRHSRREFLGLGGGALAGLGAGSWPLSGASPPWSPELHRDVLRGDSEPDLILLGGRVYTVDDRLPRAEAFAVKHGRFVAVGTSDEIRNLQGPNTRIIEAAGTTVTPGFIDCHTHPSGLSELFDVQISELSTIGEIQEMMAEKAKETPPGHWVTGSRYDDTKIVDETTGEYRRITRWDLDEAVPDHPARVGHRGGHIAWYNSKALEMAGIDRDTPDPPGGRLERNEDGELTGLVEERARELFAGVGEQRPYSREDRQAGIAHISELMTAAGITSVHQTGYAGVSSLIALQDAYAAGEMRFRMYFLPPGGGGVGSTEIYESLKTAGVRTGFGDEWLRIGGVKFGADGSLSGQTMAMSEPFIGQPDDYGILTMTQEEIHDAVEDAYAHGFQPAVHANGDVTIDRVLNAYERAIPRFAELGDMRPRIEHCSLVNPDLLRRIRDTGAVPTPFWTYVYFHGEKFDVYGEERLRWMMAHRSFLDYGIPVAPASDYGPGPFEPMMALQSMVTRRDWQGKVWGPNQRITVEEGLRIGTLHGAYASFEEDLKGSITPGKLADFVVLADDPHEVPENEIIDIEVLRTVVGGRTMHPKGEE